MDEHAKSMSKNVEAQVGMENIDGINHESSQGNHRIPRKAETTPTQSLPSQQPQMPSQIPQRLLSPTSRQMLPTTAQDVDRNHWREQSFLQQHAVVSQSMGCRKPVKIVDEHSVKWKKVENGKEEKGRVNHIEKQEDRWDVARLNVRTSEEQNARQEVIKGDEDNIRVFQSGLRGLCGIETDKTTPHLSDNPATTGIETSGKPTFAKNLYPAEMQLKRFRCGKASAHRMQEQSISSTEKIEKKKKEEICDARALEMHEKSERVDEIGDKAMNVRGKQVKCSNSTIPQIKSPSKELNKTGDLTKEGERELAHWKRTKSILRSPKDTMELSSRTGLLDDPVEHSTSNHLDASECRNNALHLAADVGNEPSSEGESCDETFQAEEAAGMKQATLIEMCTQEEGESMDLGGTTNCGSKGRTNTKNDSKEECLTSEIAESESPDPLPMVFSQCAAFRKGKGVFDGNGDRKPLVQQWQADGQRAYPASPKQGCACSSSSNCATQNPFQNLVIGRVAQKSGGGGDEHGPKRKTVPDAPSQNLSIKAAPKMNKKSTKTKNKKNCEDAMFSELKIRKATSGRGHCVGRCRQQIVGEDVSENLSVQSPKISERKREKTISESNDNEKPSSVASRRTTPVDQKILGASTENWAAKKSEKICLPSSSSMKAEGSSFGVVEIPNKTNTRAALVRAKRVRKSESVIKSLETSSPGLRRIRRSPRLQKKGGAPSDGKACEEGAPSSHAPESLTPAPRKSKLSRGSRFRPSSSQKEVLQNVTVSSEPPRNTKGLILTCSKSKYISDVGNSHCIDREDGRSSVKVLGEDGEPSKTEKPKRDDDVLNNKERKRQNAGGLIESAQYLENDVSADSIAEDGERRERKVDVSSDSDDFQDTPAKKRNAGKGGTGSAKRRKKQNELNLQSLKLRRSTRATGNSLINYEKEQGQDQDKHGRRRLSTPPSAQRKGMAKAGLENITIRRVVAKRRKPRGQDQEALKYHQKRLNMHELDVMEKVFVQFYPRPPSNMALAGERELKTGKIVSEEELKKLWVNELKSWSERWYELHDDFYDKIWEHKQSLPPEKCNITIKIARRLATEFKKSNGPANPKEINPLKNTST